jgi:hypothetical protein
MVIEAAGKGAGIHHIGIISIMLFRSNYFIMERLDRFVAG